MEVANTLAYHDMAVKSDTKQAPRWNRRKPFLKNLRSEKVVTSLAWQQWSSPPPPQPAQGWPTFTWGPRRRFGKETFRFCDNWKEIRFYCFFLNLILAKKSKKSRNWNFKIVILSLKGLFLLWDVSFFLFHLQPWLRQIWVVSWSVIINGENFL
jgi:hypothetical protein